MVRTNLKSKRAPVRDVLASVEHFVRSLGPIDFQSATSAADLFGHSPSLTWRVDNLLAEPSHGINEDAKTLRAGVGPAWGWPDG